MSPDQLRTTFLSFFEERGHRVVSSSPVVPEGDPTLLFTNAGMNQFKDVLLGLEKRDYVRAASVQKCIRAGGKHNDLDEVGKDGRHLTFFEMVGNWSFGDYYKEDAIRWAWEFVTTSMKLEVDRLYVSVYKDDDDAYDLWKTVVGLDDSRIVRLGNIAEGDEENFWSMGPTGPCGPCTEIYYDVRPAEPNVPWEPGFDEDRFVELWNLVFMEFNRDETGELTPLPMQSVDTGMGLDRAVAVLHGTESVFETPLFSAIIERTHELLTGESVKASSLYERDDFTAYTVIADHVRTVTFSVCDGAQFSNEGRGYVLRRILRRAVRYGRTLGFDGPFLHAVSSAVVETFGDVYPELRLKGEEAAEILRTEEARFFRTLDRGIALFEEVAKETVDRGETEISGDDAFQLYDTFGFPVDLTQIMAEEKGLSVDMTGYQKALRKQQSRSRQADVRYVDAGEWVILRDGAADTFVGYETLARETQVLRYRINPKDDTVAVTLVETPFYAESGGQVGDTGTIEAVDGGLTLRVIDTRRTTAGITHFAKIESGRLDASTIGGAVNARVDGRRRFLTTCNHTATHLLHAALHKFVSEKAFQAGSLVAPDRLRFDFRYEKPLSREEIGQIERWVNEQIRSNLKVERLTDVPLDDAQEMGAMAIFGEKYGERVRVVQIPGTSVELCGGCHVQETNDIAYFRILSESGVAAGVRRIEAVTNERAFELATEERNRLARIADLLRTPVEHAEQRLEKLLDELKDAEKTIDQLRRESAKSSASELAGEAEEIGGVRVIASQVSVTDRDELLTTADHLRDRVGERGAVLLAAEIDGKPALLTLVTDAAVSDHGLNAGKLINAVAGHIDGRGGGRPTLAQAGGKRLDGLSDAVAAFPQAVRDATS